MNENENKGIGCFPMILFGVFLLGTALMFSKTADLMSAFAPQSIAGYTGMEAFYGIAVAVLVDGTVAAMKLKMLFLGRAKNEIEWGWDIVLTTFPFVISAFAQVFDSFMVRDTLKSQPDTIQWLANWGIPAIPAFIVGAILVYGFITSAPAGMFSGVSGPDTGGFKLPKLFQKKANPTSGGTNKS